VSEGVDPTVDLEGDRPRAASPAARRPPRSLQVEARAKKKRLYQQKYRDKNQGLPDARRIGSALLSVVLELEASRSHPAYDFLFGKVVERLARIYQRDDVRRLVTRLREAAADAREDAEFRKRRQEAATEVEVDRSA
jgi:hypothetical protein